MDGAGRIRGDLTPECAAAVTAVLEALGKRRGPEDMRTIGQRYHDALQEGCELLIRARMVPDRAVPTPASTSPSPCPTSSPWTARPSSRTPGSAPGPASTGT